MIADERDQMDLAELQKCVQCERVDRLAYYLMMTSLATLGTFVCVAIIVFMLTDQPC